MKNWVIFSLESIVVNTDRIGKKIEHYRIDGIIGKGGMGIVYKAFDEPFDRYVAIKYLLPKFAKFQDSNDRFLREIRLMGQLPSDIPFAHAYFYGKDENASYLVMEYVDGVDLAAYVKKKTDLRKTSGPLSWREAVSYIQQAADGLKRIHRLGIVHRDIKPENIIVNKDGKIKILDLGLSSFFDPSEHLQNDHKITTESGVNHIEGTPAYLPPEVYTSSDTNNCQSDIYCLGGTLFFLLTGKLPNSWYDPLSQRDLIPTVSIKEFFQKHSIKNIPDSLLNILEKMLEPDCKKRYQNADAVCDDLQNLVAEEKKSRRRKKQTALFFLLFSLVVLLSFLIKAGNNYYNYTVSVQGMEKNISDTISTLRKVNDVLLPPNKRNEFLLKRAQFYSDQAGGNIELLKSAGEDFSRYLKRVPNDIRALIKRAGVNLKLNRLNEVRADLLLVRRLQPSDVSLLLECAELNVRLKNFTEAQSCLARAFKLDPKNINILLLEAQYYIEHYKTTFLMQDYLDRAIACLKKALEIDGGNKVIYFELAKTYTIYPKISQGQINAFGSQIAANLDRAIQLDPEFIEAISLRADYYQKNQFYEEALKDYAALLPLPQLQGTNEIYLNIASCYDSLNRTEESHLVTAIAINNQLEYKNQTDPQFQFSDEAGILINKYNKHVEEILKTSHQRDFIICEKHFRIIERSKKIIEVEDSDKNEKTLKNIPIKKDPKHAAGASKKMSVDYDDKVLLDPVRRAEAAQLFNSR